jgi:3-hydroxyisobutyrate dehydrogenase-like beta-hydroxyacid dehydrogenase
VTVVAMIGTGRMGAAMAGTLVTAGHQVVLWNRNKRKAESVADETGATVVDSAREAVSRAEVTLCSLADDAAVRAVYGGPDGLVAGLRPGTVVVESSTIDPQTVRELGPDVAGAGATLLDGPVSGSVPAAASGKLMFMVGGPPDALDAARPVLDVLAASVFHVGELGAGATMKLAVNAVVHAINVTLSESLVLAERSGVERSVAYDVFTASAGGAPFVGYKRAAFLEPDSAPVAFSLELVLKDLNLIAALADRTGVPMRQAERNMEITRAAVEAGLGDRDMSVLAEVIRSQS